MLEHADVAQAETGRVDSTPIDGSASCSCSMRGIVMKTGGGAADVAEALGMTYEVAKVRLSRARQRARAIWAQA